MDSWEQLARKVRDELRKLLPEVKIDWTYGGDAVDFSPQPLAEKIRQQAAVTERVMILPALVSVGVVQTEVIPPAIAASEVEHQVIYPHDAVLPDSELVEEGVAVYWSVSEQLMFVSLSVLMAVRGTEF